MILRTRQGRYRVKVKEHGVIVADRTFARWNDAEAWEADRKRMVATGRLAPASAGRTPLAQVYAAWTQVRPGQVQERTWQSDQSAWTSHLATRFGRMPVGSITSRDVHSFAHDVHAGHAAGTVRRIIATLVAMLDFTVDHRWIEANPARIPLTLGHDPQRHPRHVTLEPAELLAVWAVQRRFSPLASVTVFLGLTGLRWGEFVALRPGDLLTTAIGGPMVHVARSIVRARGEGAPTVKSTKSSANRLVPLAHLAADVANSWANGKDRQALLVPGPDGGPLRPSTFRRQVHWTQAVPAGFRIHDLRHSCATNLLTNGADILGVQGILGHASPDTTLRYYGHLTGAEHLRAAMDHYEQPLTAGGQAPGGALGAPWPPVDTLALLEEIGNPQQYQRISRGAASGT
ncbi:MAG: tyrosine-type recombinase/integrase [Actinomycetota bacterium]|nr:tyrosine-type recombinase/integrase [Actinomycetota bacterium]